MAARKAQMTKVIAYALTILLCCVPTVFADNYDIERITPIFNKATPGFGEFQIEVEIKVISANIKKLNVACLYSGLTNPGVYFKNEPQISKQYKVVEVPSSGKVMVLFDKGFMAYHPSVVGEIIVSIVGTNVVRGLSLKTAFHPRSND